MTEPELDPKLAAKLRAAAEHEPYAVLDDDARLRVLRALQNEPKRTKRFPWVNLSMAAAAAALFAVMLRPTNPPAGPQCALPTDVSFQQRKLDLRDFGRVHLADDAEATITRAEACALEITLTRGTLGAALHDLKPASLTVRTPFGAVEVHGTTFSVAVAEELEVVLLEGAVSLRDEQSTTMLEPGHALTRRRGAAPHKQPMQPAQECTLRRLVDGSCPVGEPEVVAPAPVAPQAVAPVARSATELLAAAERARRDRDPSRARSLYREAGAAKGADAEVALLRWARLELEEAPNAALDVLARYRARYGRKLERARLGAEASFLEVQVLDKLGRRDEARAHAQELVRRYPDSPHAQAAAKW